MENQVLTIAFGSHTLIGSSGAYPRSIGNCFDLQDKDRVNYKIVNFIYENLTELFTRGLTWPVKIKVLEETKGIAVIHDERIPDAWYRPDFCEVCCPESLLPIHHSINVDKETYRKILADLFDT